MAAIVVLANSKRPDGQCVAGIDVATGRWARLVTRDADAVPEERCFLGSHFLSLGDILEVELIHPDKVAKYQCENHIIHNWRWRVEGRMRPDALARYVDDTAPLFFSRGDRVAPSFLETLPPDHWKSLQLVRPRGLRFVPDPHDPNRLKVEFQDAAANRYRLKVTDFEAISRARRGCLGNTDDVFLTVSLTKPWTRPGSDRPPWCYKIVAAVIDGH
ncbi:MAG: hypothetical protein JW818_08525 [Pirellulales bacterium]|nr:hypothetical protein [Pirellulales bacterium]